jgi:hypothetical protein
MNCRPENISDLMTEMLPPLLSSHDPSSWPLLPLPAITPLNQTTQESYTCSAVTNPPAYRAPPFPLTQKAQPY